jgi:hypothetical protein
MLVEEADIEKITASVLEKLDERIDGRHPKPQLMLDWLLAEGKKDKSCRRCVLRPTAEWYYSLLEEKGYQSLADGLQEAADTEDKALVCATFDEIKAKVTPEVRDTLEDFDWYTQDAAATLDIEAVEDAASTSDE